MAKPYVNAGVKASTLKPPAKPPAKAAPKQTKGTVKPQVKTGMAGLYGGQGPTAYVNGLYAPQEQALAAGQAARQAALKSIVGEFLTSLKGVSSELAPYTAAGAQQNSDAARLAASLAAANPNAVTQNDLAAINAPAAQQQQVAGQNNAVYGGNAALLQYTGGHIPADQFASDAAGRAAFLQALPAIAAGYGTRGANQLAYLASQENMKLAADKAQALQKARSDLASYVQNNQNLRLKAQNQAFSQAATSKRLDQADTRLGLQAQTDAFNRQYKTQSLSLSARRFAQSVLKSDRSYGLELQRLGISKKSLQLRALAQEYKLRNGGFTPTQTARFQSDAKYVIDQARTAKATPDYQTVMDEMLKRHVPVSIADKTIRSWNPVLQGTPVTPALLKDYNTLVGVGAKSPLDVVYAAKSMLGTPYVWGGNQPGKALDCSAFIQQAYARLGIKIPRTTYDQVKAGRPVSLNQLQPGDAVFTRPGKNGPNHVGMYIGNGQVQESPHTGEVNKIIPLQDFLSGGFVAARRYLP